MVQQRSTVPPEVAQVGPSRAIHAGPRVHMRQQTCLLCDTTDCCVTQHTCLLCYTADMSAVPHSKHVCCVTQQTCLSCLRHKTMVLPRRRGGASPPMPTAQLSATAHRRLRLRKTLVLRRRRGGASPSLPATQNHSLCRKQNPWTQIDDSLLDLDTCLMPEAQSWTDLNCTL